MHKAIKLLGAKMHLYGEIRWMSISEIEEHLRDEGGKTVVRKLVDTSTSSPSQLGVRNDLLPKGHKTHRPIRQWQAFRTMHVPAVLFPDSYDQLGLPPKMPEGTMIRGTAVSPGFVEGTAFIPKTTSDSPPSAPFILIVEHPDTSWLPLMTRAVGMIFAVGGVLSHGAIVARELGLPAVGQIPEATTQFKPGERLTLNGSTGEVSRQASRSEAIK
jgi:phosphohistidine swiveling domain-containing protein